MSSGYSHYKISLAKPCTESWNEMTPVEGGRFCSLCQHTVTDFTKMTDAEVQQFLIGRKGQRTCGHFYNSQLERIRIQLPSYFFQKKIPVWQKYLVVFLCCFGSHLYSIDLNIGNQSGLYAQTTQLREQESTKHKKNRKKQKNKKQKNLIFLKVELSQTMDGIIRLAPQASLEMPKNDLPDLSSLLFPGLATSHQQVQHDDSCLSKTDIAASASKEQQPRPYSGKKRWLKSPFILPTIYRMRRKPKRK